MHPPRGPSILDPIPDFEPYVEEDVAGFDWGDFGSTLLGYAGDYASGRMQAQAFRSLTGGQPAAMAIGAPGATVPPRSVTVDTLTGKVTPCRRRRRRRLLTSSDLADLASLKAIVGGGAAMNAAVVKAVRR